MPAQALHQRLARWSARCWRTLAGLLGGLLAGHGAQAVTLPENKAETLMHAYRGGGVDAYGPAFLVRRSLGERVSLSGAYTIDMVSNASIDVVTNASPFKETRHQVDVGADWLVRDAMLSLSTSQSREPDYHASNFSVDVAQEVYGLMSTVSMGFTRGMDKVGRVDTGFFDQARTWQYRLGLTQVLSPTWIASLNFEAISNDGYLGNPYRTARVFGAAVPERVPRTRSSRALKLRAVGDLGQRDALRAEYRYFWDNWDVRAHTLEFSYSRYVGNQWLADAVVRGYTQGKALFYSDNAQTETTYITRNRQLSAFNSLALGARLSKPLDSLPARYSAKLTGSYEYKINRFNDFTDLRNGEKYRYNAHVLQLLLSGTF
jgi:hypothetical protein